MPFKPTLFNCSEKEFKERFAVNEQQWDKYTPLFLGITHSNSGECAPSYGIFGKNNMLYTVYGDECSVWDFNGQFNPELTTLEYIRMEIKNGMGGTDVNDGFNHELKEFVTDFFDNNELGKGYGRSGDTTLVDYYNYVRADDLGSIKMNYGDMVLFKDNLVEVEDGVEYYRFNYKSDTLSDVVFYIRGNGFLSLYGMGEYEAVNNNLSFVRKFISDIKGSIELKINIFSDKETSENIKKSSPKKPF